MAVVVHRLEEPLHGHMVAGLAGADEVVVGDAQLPPGLDEPHARAVGPLLGADTVGLGLPSHLEAVLVGAGQVEDVVTEESVPSGEAIGYDGRVGVPHVRSVVDVVDGCRQEEAGHCRLTVPTAPR